MVETEKKPLQILIIDNHAELVKQIETRLSYEEDLKVCMVAPLKQISDGLLACNPDVLLIDPYFDNSYKYDLIKYAMDTMPSLVVVVWTAVVDTAMHVRLKKLGVHLVLEKGISSKDLVDALRGVIVEQLGQA
ncbi:response regulator [bacterium]|nr:response regulator [bacterium]